MIAQLKKWQRSVDEGGQVGTLLPELSKAFDCIDHELLIAKFYAYGLINIACNYSILI